MSSDVAARPADPGSIGRLLRRVAGNAWVRFAFRRARRLVLSLVVVVTASFFMVQLIPGDPVRAALGPTAPKELVDARREALGLDNPVLVQFADYVRGLLTGDWGESMFSGLPVVDIILTRLPATLELAGLAFVVIMVSAVLIGTVMAALTRGGRRARLEFGFTLTSIVIEAIPGFVLAVAFIMAFGVSLGWLPVAGRGGPESYVLPVLSLTLAALVTLARVMRVEMLATLQSDYVRTARSKRLSSRRIYLRHALPNAATSMMTIGGLLLGGLLVGTVFIEKVFAWPGLGTTLVNSVLTKDYPVVQGLVLGYGVGVLLINLLVDVILALMDPRSAIRES